jgi:hypothetical protein
MATSYLEHIDFPNDAAGIESGPTLVVFDVIRQRLQNGA